MIGSNFIFIHIRKNGGMSVEQFFRDNNLVVEEDTGGMGLKSPYWEEYKHIPSIAIIRDPYTRVISSWKYCTSTRNKPLIVNLIAPPSPFENNILAQESHDYRHFTMQQTDFIADEAIEVDYLIHFENIEEELKQVLEEMNIKVYEPLRWLNKGDYEPYPLSGIEKAMIHNKYEKDFDLLNY